MSFLRLVKTAAVLGIGAWGSTASAMANPEDTVTIVVPYVTADATDASVNFAAQAFQRQSGGMFIVGNVAVVSTTIRRATVGRAEPEGCTLLWSGLTSNAMGRHLHPILSYDGIASLAPVSPIPTLPYTLFVSATSPLPSWRSRSRMQSVSDKLDLSTPGVVHLT